MSSTTFTPPYPDLSVPADPSGRSAVQFDETDISTRQKRTLGSYLSSLTTGKVPGADTDNPNPYNGQIPPNHANPYPIAEPGQPQQSFTTGAAGAVHEAIDLESRPSELFGDVDEIVNVAPLGQASSTRLGSGPELFDGLIGTEPGGASTRAVTLNAKKYATTLGESLRKKNANSGETLVNNQSVVADRSFTNENNTSSVAAVNGIKIQPYGTSSRIALGDSLGKSYDAADIKRASGKDLSSIGASLMARAMGVSPTDNEKWLSLPAGLSQIDSSSTRVAAIASDDAPSLSTLNRTMLSRGQDQIPSGDDIGNTPDSYTGKSWPTSYSPDSTFTGLETGRGAFAAFVLGGTFVAAVLAAAALGVLIPPINPSSVPAEINSGTRNSRKLKLGEFRYAPDAGAGSIISAALDGLSGIAGVTFTNPIYAPTNPEVGFGDCVVAGLASFLGVSLGIDLDIIFRAFFLTANGNTLIQLGAITARLAVIYADPTSRQYYMTIIRELNRNTVALGSRIADGGGVAAAGAAALSVIGIGSAPSVFDSKLFKFVNTLAQIGDLAYTQAAAIEARGTDIETSPSYAYTEESGFNMAAAIAGVNTTAKGFAARRVYGDKIVGRRGTTLGISDLPSAHLIPNAPNQSYRSLLTGDLADRMKKVEPNPETGRIDPKTVRAIESVLDSEYMPFYFHDLRTNEIIAFHAFLDDLTDSYTANYNGTSGYGRIENVQTYKDTKRSVGCTFHIVGMNPRDFDYMYWQINKLTTMVYPQWSEGRKMNGKVNGTDFAFAQPFSQIPTATPVIRLRVGDLIRSNYSRFNLKRLFGYQDTEKKQSRSKINSGTTFYTISPGRYSNVDGTAEYKLEKTVTAIKDPVKSQVYYDNVFKIISAPGDPFAANVSIVVDARNYAEFKAESYDSSGNVTEFYDPGQNSVIRSFETTAGMGLAAVVTQLGFTWMDGLWGVGEDGPGNRAPRSCKVQMSFEPIHDIAPGLDHDGFNRAPIYPVGKLINGIVEGGEQEPYGAGTSPRDATALDGATSQIAYEESFKPNFLGKLF
jgi:hypothetical protein